MAENGEKGKLLSPALMGFLRRRAMEACGLLLILAGGAFTAMLFSPGRLDPSWSAFSPGPVNNWFGPVGAAIAGGLRTSLGAASFFATLLPLGWGYRLLRKQEIGQRVARLFLAPVALLLLASGIYGLSGGDGSAAGGAAGVVLLGLTMPHVPPVPSVLGLGLAHYLGAGYALLGLMLWSWSATLSRRQWALLVMPVRMLARLVGGVLRPRRAEAEDGGEDAPALELTETSEPVAEAGKAVAKKRPRKAAGKKKRQEPTIIDTGGDTAAPAAPAAGQGRLDFGGDGQFRLPPAKLLKAPGKAASGLSKQELEATAVELETVLGDFSVKGEITESRYGPVVTRHDLEPAPGTKSQRVISLADDIARSMSAVSVRVAVVPGQNVIGIELPNTDRQVVVLREILDHAVWQSDGSNLPMALGKDIAGAPVIVDLAKMPHLLVAGTTGSGKSVGINAMILSLLYRHTPETCRMILVDPKMLELSVYDGIPHLLSPVVTEPSKAVTALKWAVREMETRYRNMAKLNVRNIAGYNERVAKARDEGEVLTRRVQTGFDAETGRPVFEEEILDLTPLPFIVVVIDEVADLMLVAGKEIEAAVQRLAQMARAAGIHVIMATQRPSVDVITGTIKANFPTRISFQVTSRIDSRTILGEQGAEQLLGRGDMLFMEGGGRVTRVHGPFVSDDEVQAVADFLRKQGEPDYNEKVVAEEEEADAVPSGGTGDLLGGNSLYDQAVQLVIREQKASTSFVQRHLKIGYNRAATIIEEMEGNGIISAANHVGKREVLVSEEAGQ
ncbi:MAG: DNA translocase FtsK 4TM domain-containing protein [Pseudomonadota bacterium]|nr:DNA translocase FtsK 4TM domain-containing protein [Pseudomonadota bacterium]